MAAPDQTRALAAMKHVQALDGPAMKAKIDAQVGDAMQSVLTALARSLFPGDDAAATAKKVDLMVLGYLLRAELEPHEVEKI